MTRRGWRRDIAAHAGATHEQAKKQVLDEGKRDHDSNQSHGILPEEVPSSLARHCLPDQRAAGSSSPRRRACHWIQAWRRAV